MNAIDDSGLRAALQLAHEGTAYFLRRLGELRDEEFPAASLLPGWTRAHVVSHVGYNALGLTRLLRWAATGVETPMYESPEAREREIEEGARLGPEELRRLVSESATTLDAGWRELPDDAWNAEVRTVTGAPITAATTVWMRSREVWLHAVDLDNGGSFDDFPQELLDHLIANVLSTWRQRDAEGIPNLSLQPTDRADGRPPFALDPGRPAAIVLHGTTAALAAWAAGRSDRGVTTADGSPAPAAPRWI